MSHTNLTQVRRFC